MKTIRPILASLVLLPLAADAQERYATRTGHVSFFSATPMENIEANNYKVTSVLDATTGAVEFAALMKAFEFEKALMQEHFNENYMESNTYPKATFKGKVTGLPTGALGKPGKYPVTVEGDLTMHGVAKKLSLPASVVVNPTGAILATSEFTVKAEDYNIDIPNTVRDNIAKEIKVKVAIDYQKM